MAYILNAGKSIISPYDGTLLTSAYAIVDNINVNKEGQRATFDLKIYVSRAARVAGYRHLDSYMIVAQGADYLTYFNPSLNTKIWTQAHNWLINGGLATTPLVVTDWKIDPQAEP